MQQLYRYPSFSGLNSVATRKTSGHRQTGYDHRIIEDVGADKTASRASGRIASDDTEAVVFDFVQPGLAGRRLWG
jgi:hypothetical protein